MLTKIATGRKNTLLYLVLVLPICLMFVVLAARAESQEEWILETGVASRKNADFKLAPTSVGSGPALFFTTRKDDRNLHYVVWPEQSTSPALYLDYELPITIEARVDQGIYLASGVLNKEVRSSSLFLIDLQNGLTQPLETTRPIDATANTKLLRARTSFHSVEGHRIYFLQNLSDGDIGYKINDMGSYRAPLSRLCFLTPDLDTAKPLTNQPVEKILTENDNHFLVISPGSELWTIEKATGITKRIKTFQPSAVPSQISAKLSPKGDKVALGISKDDEIFSERDLVVLSIEDGKELSALMDVPVRVSSLSSSFPRLELIWLGEESLRLSLSELTKEKDPRFVPEDDKGYFSVVEGYFRWADFDIVSRKLRVHDRYSTLSLGHVTPKSDSLSIERPKRCREGLFERDYKTLFVPGTNKVLASSHSEKSSHTNWGPIVSPDGRWAVLQDPKKDQALFIVNGAALTSAQTFPTWTFSIGWDKTGLFP